MVDLCVRSVTGEFSQVTIIQMQLSHGLVIFVSNVLVEIQIFLPCHKTLRLNVMTFLVIMIIYPVDTEFLRVNSEHSRNTMAVFEVVQPNGQIQDKSAYLKFLCISRKGSVCVCVSGGGGGGVLVHF